MTALHRFLFDLRPVQKVLSVIEADLEPSLHKQAEEIRQEANLLLDGIYRQNVRPSTKADLIVLDQIVKLSPEEFSNLYWPMVKDLFRFVSMLLEYFSAVKAIRGFCEAEKSVKSDIQQLLDNIYPPPP